MHVRTFAAAGLAIVLAGASIASAQTGDPTRTAIEGRATAGDRLTITTRDGVRSTGRLVDTSLDSLMLRSGDGQRSFAYADIDRVQRHKNGVALGALIGTGVGLLFGTALRSWANNESADGDRIFAICLASGIGIGTGIDALAGSTRTIYRRPAARTGLDLQPQKGGGAVGWTVRW